MRRGVVVSLAEYRRAREAAGSSSRKPDGEPATQSERDLRTFVTIAQNVAIEDAKRTPTTDNVRRRARAIVAEARRRLAELSTDDDG